MGLHKTLGPQQLGALSGLSGAEAERRLQQVGPNREVSKPRGPARRLAAQFWGPAAGLLELAIVIELAAGRPLDGAVTGVVLAAHAAAAFLQQNYSQKVLDRYAQQLSPTTRVLRDGAWQLIPSAGVVPGDMVYVQAGERAPADLRLVSGRIALEAAASGAYRGVQEASSGEPILAGSLIRRGEATGEVTATGPRTAFGQASGPDDRTHGPSRFQGLTERAVRRLALFEGAACAAALAYFAAAQVSLAELLPFALILLLAALPVALPETLKLAISVGANELSEQGVKVKRLSAIEDAAELQVMCIDKAGALTENRLTVERVRAYPPYDELDVLHLAAMASDENTQDPMDLAILEKTRTQGVPRSRLQRRSYAPAGPATRHSEAVYEEDGDDLRVIKGTPAAVLGLVGSAGQEAYQEMSADIHAISTLGSQVIAVAVGTGIDPPHLAGLVALQDPMRPDSTEMVGRLRHLGVKVVMITSEPRQSAQAAARQVGLTGEFCSGTAAAVDAATCDVYAELLPEDKINLVRAQQQAGYRVGVTGDSLEDGPALQQAELGVAVAGAEDGERAASLALTQPGLENLVTAIVSSRQISQRMLAATLSKLVKGMAITLVLGLGLALSGSFLLTPLLVALLVLSSDFTGIALAFAARSTPLPPKRWQWGGLLLAAAVLALPMAALGLGAFWFGQTVLHLSLAQAQTLVFAALGFSSQGLLYLGREPRAFWVTNPGRGLVIGSILAIAAITLMAALGILMAALPLGVILEALAISLAWMGMVDFIKVRSKPPVSFS